MNFKEFSGKKHADLISIIIPIYKNFDGSRLKISIDSLKNQKDVNLEIIVAEQSEYPTLNSKEGISYVFVPQGKHIHANPGFVRNQAAKVVKGDYIYNSDGDIVYMNPFYLAEILELIKTGKEVALCRPSMRRLPIEDFNVFNSIYEKCGLQVALNSLNIEEPFNAKVPGSKNSIGFIKKKESGRIKTFLYSDSDFEKYKSNVNLQGSEPQYFTLAVHAGGTFMEKKQFDSIGGFCERFNAWGCHDADLQWKLRKKFNLIEFPNLPEYEVLHLDHERVYFNKKIWNENLKLQKLRREKNIDEIIKEDLKNGN